MPHCIIEYSKKLEDQVLLPELVQAVHSGALDSSLFSLAAIKTRAVAYDHYLVGGEKTLDFIHVSVRILSGRTDTQKTLLSSTIFNKLKNLELTSVSLSVEILDIHTESYAK